MPPSPALRCSPGHDVGIQNTHKRGRSLESGFPLKPKDDDLALFNDMQNRERDSFLLHASDDLDDSIGRLRYYSDFKLGINIPARGESSDLLNTDGEKNDYDWLLTPPDTPLFPSLDDEEPQPVHLAPRGRQRSQPISIRSSMTETTHRTSRSSPSPHRLSPSPRSTTGVNQSRGTPPSGGSYSSPTAIVRPTTPSRRPSTPTKPSTPPPRSSTPTLRRLNNGSNGQGSSSGRGTSPVTTNRGNSASPKLRGWQTNLPGFSCDPPPNLRTTLADRPSSYIRGSSPASGNGRQSMSPTASRNRRQSMSPTASRSASSSHSHDRDRFSSYSKGSAASSCDDDLDSLHSSGAGMSYSSISTKNGTAANGRTMVFSKKPVRTPSASSAPKRSFDSALRQMDRKTPPNMFRPLLSSVPTTTLYVGRANNMNRPMFSRNSSLTTSSNASSEQGAFVVPDMGVSDHHQNDLSGKREKPQNPELHEEIFILDEADETPVSGKPIGDMTNSVDSEGLEKSAANSPGAVSMGAASESLYAAGNPSVLEQNGMLVTCSKCGNPFRRMYVDPITGACQECAENNGLVTEGTPQSALRVAQNEKLQSPMADGKDRWSNKAQLAMEVSELPEKSSSYILPLDDMHAGQVHNSLVNSSGLHLDLDLIQHHHSDPQENNNKVVNATQTYNKFQQSQEVGHQSTRVESPEGTGISVLLQRSSSNKWPVVQGRSFSATNILCSEPSYARDHASSMKRSMSRDSASASSSVDMGSSRQPDYRMQCQLSSKKGEMENTRNYCNVDTQSAESFKSGVSTDACGAVVCPNTETEQHFRSFDNAEEFEARGKREPFNEVNENFMKNTQSGCIKSLAITHAVNGLEREVFDCADDCMTMDSSRSQLSHSYIKQDHDTSATLALNDGCASCINSEGLLSDERITRGADAKLDMHGSSVFEQDRHIPTDSVCGNDISGVVSLDSSCIISEPQVDLGSFSDLQRESSAVHNQNITDVSHDYSASTISEKDILASASKSNILDYSSEKSMAMTAGPSGCMSRSFTLEEATDTILFCSSIIHDLAYKAANIGMEKEETPFSEAPRPTPTILGNRVYNRKDLWTPSNKRAPKLQKTRLKRLETNANTMAVEQQGEDTKVQRAMPLHPQVSSKVDSAKPPKLESKCNCTIM